MDSALQCKSEIVSMFYSVSGEESDRMLDTDPRIVLRPLNKVEDA